MDDSAPSPTVQRWRDALAEMDQRGVPDAEYRTVLSSWSRTPLQRGMTWRARLHALAYGSPDDIRQAFRVR